MTADAANDAGRKRFIDHFMQAERPLRAYLYAATGDFHDTDDLFQIVWARLWEKFDQYDESRPFKVWALGFARVEALRWRQDKARCKETLSPDAVALLADTADQFSGEINSRRHVLHECMKRLDESRRRLLEMKYVKGLQAKQISQVLGRSRDAVEMALVRVRHFLRQCVEKNLPRFQDLQR